jgi:hypothetical protein
MDMAVITVDAGAFVPWILDLPARKLMKPVPSKAAADVARRLYRIGLSRGEEGSDLVRLATDVFGLALRIGSGAMASHAQCKRFLDDFGPYLLGHDLGKARTILGAVADPGRSRDAKRTREPGLGKGKTKARRIEYRITAPAPFAPMATYGGATGKVPTDDLSERISEALDALRKAGCRRPYAFVAQTMKALGKFSDAYCTANHVQSRERKFAQHRLPADPELPHWLFCYWLTLAPENSDKTASDPGWPERFVFKRCAG